MAPTGARVTDLSADERNTYLPTKRAAGYLTLEEVGAVRQAVGQIRTIVADAVKPLAAAVEKMDVTRDIRANAVRSLQFADIVEQLGAYCDGELDNVERLARDLNRIVNDVIDDSPGALGRLVEFQHALDARLEGLRAVGIGAPGAATRHASACRYFSRSNRQPRLGYHPRRPSSRFTAMSKPRITAAMLRPRSSPARSVEPPAADDKPMEPAAHHEAVASHPQFVAPQFGYRRAPTVAGEQPLKRPRLPRLSESR